MNLQFYAYVNEYSRRLQLAEAAERAEQNRALGRYHRPSTLARLTEGIRLLAQVRRVRIQISFDVEEPRPGAAGGC